MFIKKRYYSKKEKPFNLNLTPLINILAILIFFLIKSFSTEGELISRVADLELPVSTSRQSLRLNLNLLITKTSIIVDDREVEKTARVLNSPDILIKPLQAALKEEARKSKEIAQFNKTVKFRGKITIQGDKAIPFKVLKKVMYTCGQTEYSNIFLAVFRDEKQV